MPTERDRHPQLLVISEVYTTEGQYAQRSMGKGGRGEKTRQAHRFGEGRSKRKIREGKERKKKGTLTMVRAMGHYLPELCVRAPALVNVFLA